MKQEIQSWFSTQNYSLCAQVSQQSAYKARAIVADSNLKEWCVDACQELLGALKRKVKMTS